MPFITLYLPRGCDDGALETSMREITAAGASCWRTLWSG
jgi:hypothetical protein